MREPNSALEMVASFFLASIVALGSLLAPQGLPSPAPEPAAVSSPVPEIGRVRSAAPACTVLRDVIAPSFLAARKADASYEKVTDFLTKYVDAMDDPGERFGPIQNMLLHRLDSSVSLMTQDVQTLTKALRDPRLLTSDPQIQAQRAQLEQLQEMQLARSSILLEFVQRQQVAIAKNQIDASAFNGRGGGPAATPDPGPTRYSTTQPHFSGNSMVDATTIRDWTGGIASEIRTSENTAARTFIGVQHDCKL
ncbi:MAG: hypothetical protein NVSMB64_19500 [Candidatus Velthaea sp.]